MKATQYKDAEAKKALIPDLIAFLDMAPKEHHEEIARVLKVITKQDLGTKGKTWGDWWTKYGKDFVPGT